MQRAIFISLTFLSLFGFISCLSETESGDIIFENDPIKNRNLIYSFTNDTHQIELYSRDTALYEGYNDILIRIKDKSEMYIFDVDVSWEAIASDSTTAPIADVVQSVDNPDVYNSFLTFPKASSTKDWSLYITYQIQSTTYTASTELNVIKPDENRITIENQMGMDNKSYLIVLTDPYNPINGFNNCSLMIYEVQSPSNYKIRQNLSVQVWSSKDDYVHDVVVDLPFQSYSDSCQNKLELIDVGIWQLNVVVKNEHNNIILGEEKSANQLTSSLHFPLATDSQ